MDAPVILRTFDNDFAANIAKTRLEAYGIPAILNNEIMSDVWALPTASFGTIRLLVDPQNFEEADKILNDLD